MRTSPRFSFSYLSSALGSTTEHGTVGFSIAVLVQLPRSEPGHREEKTDGAHAAETAETGGLGGGWKWDFFHNMSFKTLIVCT